MKKIIKPWGYELLLYKSKDYCIKKLFMKKSQRCSLQLHKKKKETFYVLDGSLELTLKINNKTNLKIFKNNEYFTIKPGQIHRMKAKKNTTYLEVSTNFLNDVVRLEDDYLRKIKNKF